MVTLDVTTAPGLFQSCRRYCFAGRSPISKKAGFGRTNDAKCRVGKSPDVPGFVYREDHEDLKEQTFSFEVFEVFAVFRV
jgi:hypothetical protein